MKRVADRRLIALCFVFGAVLAGLGILIDYWSKNTILWYAIGLLQVALLLFIIVEAATKVTVTEQYVVKTVFGKVRHKISLDVLREVGLMGIQVFRIPNTDAAGGKYIYFSERSLTDDERYHMFKYWPPRKMIYVSYDPVLLEEIQKLWGGRVTYYNFASEGKRKRIR